jgi:hypothetical protein
MAMDYELWGKFFLAGARFEYTGVHFGIFRQHPAQKTRDMLSINESMLTVATKLVGAADRFSREEKSRILADLDEYGRWYKQEHWRCSGRLTRLGLPPIIVKPLRRIRARLQERLKSYA